jgi:DNA ligase (NAD+)
MDINALVQKLQRANWAYRNTDTLLMSDSEYDTQLELLRKLSPAHPFLTMVGAKPDLGQVLLPITMGSLEKVIHETGDLARWKKRKLIIPVKDFIVSGKVDGVSFLFVSNGTASGARLYLRGDGVTGVCISKLIPQLRLPTHLSCIVRGELVLPFDKTPEGGIGRSIVNGWVHRALGSYSLEKELATIDCVGYQVIEPLLTRSQQFEWLSSHGFLTPPFAMLKNSSLDESKAFEILKRMRNTSQWPLDGIVIGTDTVPVSLGGGEAKDPPDAVAYKAALDEQMAETEITSIEWNISRQNLCIPTILIKPVTIGNANIQRLSGHNANFIVDHILGPGAKIVIIRSGDVIPYLKEVKCACPTGPSMPTVEWTWDANRIHAVCTAGDSSELQIKALYHAIDTLGVQGIGETLVKKIVDSGIRSLRLLLDSNPTIIGAAIGQGRGSTLLPALKAAVSKASIMTLMIASNLLPKGVGERKLRPLFVYGADPRAWSMNMFSTKGICPGWTNDSMEVLLKALPPVIQWCTSINPDWTHQLTIAAVVKPVPSVLTTAQRFVAFTSCRPDDALKALMDANGWVMDDLKKNTVLLVTADGAKETGKVTKAKEKGIEICSISEFRARF